MEGAEAAALIAPAGLIDWLRPLAAELGLRLCCTVGGARRGCGSGPFGAARGDADAVAYLQFSSGSTRFPIGVVVLHRALMANAPAS